LHNGLATANVTRLSQTGFGKAVNFQFCMQPIRASGVDNFKNRADCQKKIKIPREKDARCVTYYIEAV
jgi:hypothetical protein